MKAGKWYITLAGSVVQCEACFSNGYEVNYGGRRGIMFIPKASIVRPALFIEILKEKWRRLWKI